jgi:hypothetical protein
MSSEGEYGAETRMNTGDFRLCRYLLLHAEMRAVHPFKAWVAGSNPAALTTTFPVNRSPFSPLPLTPA